MNIGEYQREEYIERLDETVPVVEEPVETPEPVEA